MVLPGTFMIQYKDQTYAIVLRRAGEQDIVRSLSEAEWALVPPADFEISRARRQQGVLVRVQKWSDWPDTEIETIHEAIAEIERREPQSSQPDLPLIASEAMDPVGSVPHRYWRIG